MAINFTKERRDVCDVLSQWCRKPGDGIVRRAMRDQRYDVAPDYFFDDLPAAARFIAQQNSAANES